MAAARSSHGDRPTRRLIAETATRLFREHGYEATTMRLIAREAGVAVGNAYHYFPSKQDLVQELYRLVQEDHRDRAAAALARARTLDERLHVVLRTGVDALAPYREFGSVFVSTAVRPGSAASAGSRALAVGLFRTAVEGARPAVRGPLADELPTLLRLVHLGVTTYWVHDDSPGSARTHALVDALAPMAAHLIRLSRLPVARGLADDVLALVRGAGAQAPDSST